MGRWSIVAGALCFLVMMAGGPGPAAAPPSRFILVYVSAWNCPYCREWEVHTQPNWERAPERRHVDFRIVKTPYFSRVDEDRYWPEDIRWIRDSLQITKGTPRFILAIDRGIVLHRFGASSWDKDVYPLIQRLVTEKTSP